MLVDPYPGGSARTLTFCGDATGTCEFSRKLAPEELAQRVQQALAALRADHAGSSQAPARALVLAGAPDAAAGEITDKGYVNQRLVLQRRAADVAALYAVPVDARVVLGG